MEAEPDTRYQCKECKQIMGGKDVFGVGHHWITDGVICGPVDLRPTMNEEILKYAADTREQFFSNMTSVLKDMAVTEQALDASRPQDYSTPDNAAESGCPVYDPPAAHKHVFGSTQHLSDNLVKVADILIKLGYEFEAALVSDASIRLRDNYVPLFKRKING